MHLLLKSTQDIWEILEKRRRCSMSYKMETQACEGDDICYNKQFPD